MPSWIAPLVVREVSEDPRYRNSALAMLSGDRGTSLLDDVIG